MSGKRLIAVLAFVLLAASAQFCPAKPNAAGTEPATPPKPDLAGQLVNSKNSPPTIGGSRPLGTGPGLSTDNPTWQGSQTQKNAFATPAKWQAESGNDLAKKLLISILLIVVLGVAAIYVSRKFLPRITNAPGRKIRIIETVHLAPNKAVHLLRVGTQQLLIASSKEGICFLTEVTGNSSMPDVPGSAVRGDARSENQYER